jgi:DNA-directed RNA polymerase specialized sigma24 family protein
LIKSNFRSFDVVPMLAVDKPWLARIHVMPRQAQARRLSLCRVTHARQALNFFFQEGIFFSSPYPSHFLRRAESKPRTAPRCELRIFPIDREGFGFTRSNLLAIPDKSAIIIENQSAGRLSMRSGSSISRCLSRLKTGDVGAFEPIWRRYYRQLVERAYRKLRGKTRRVADEEDVVLSAFESFVRGVRRGRFPELRNRDDLWRLIVTIVERKAYDRNAAQFRLKRGGSKVAERLPSSRGERCENDTQGERFASLEPTPAEAAATAETLKMLLELLDSELRRVALGKLEGYTNQELAVAYSCSLATVERKLRLIRKIWTAFDVFGR